MISRRAFLATPLALLAADRKPNVTLVIAPGWRGLATPWAGDSDIEAPNLVKFAADSVVFPRAYACDPQADPARSGILTGRFPHVNGVIADGAPMRTEEITLDAVLKLAGYKVLDRVEAIESNATGPFFLNISLTPPRDSKPANASRLHLRENVPPDLADKARLELAERYGVYTSLDQQFGRILAALERANAARDTIVVFTSGHGEMIGSHGMEGAGSPYEESSRVPFAIRFPRAFGASASAVAASHVDILPTVLGLCGEPAFEGIQGYDLSPSLREVNGDHPESLFAEGRLGQKDEWRMVVVGMDKLVVDGEGTVTHLFNLAEDPYEMKNLAHESSVQLKRDGLLATLRASRSRLLDFKRR